MARGASKLRKSEPFSATDRRQEGKLTYPPVFREANRRMACCPTLLQAAQDSHPKCVAWHLKLRGCLPKLLRHQNARVQRPLHEAAGAKPTNDNHKTPPCTLCVEKMLAVGLKPSWPDENGRFALERAAMVGCVPCIETLLRSTTTYGANSTDAFCGHHSAALAAAARINSEASVRALLGATPAAPVGLLSVESGLGSALIEAVKAGAYDCVTPLVKAGAVLNPVGHARRPVPLIAAADRKCTTDKAKDDRAPDVIRLLVKLGAEVNAEEPTNGQTALHVSASTGHLGCMQALVELGANPTALDTCGGSPLHLAASSHHAEACRLLVKHITETSGAAAAVAALLTKDKTDRSPLYSTFCWEISPKVVGCFSTLLRLLEASGGPQAVAGALREKVGDNGRTIVHSAAKLRSVDCLKALMEAPEALRVALEAEDNDGTTPIALAREAGHDLDDVAAFTQVSLVPCCSGLVEATEKGHVTCVRHILKDGCRSMAAGSVPQGGDLDPLSSSIPHNGHKCSKIVRLCLEAGFHPDGRHGDFVPLRNAVNVEFDPDNGVDGICVECTRLLIEAGGGGLLSSVTTNEVGDTAMWSILYHASTCDSNDECTQLAKAALEACRIRDDEYGVTDLVHWAGGRNTELPRLLVDAGAGVNKTDSAGRTALHMAAGLLELDLDEDEEDDLRDSDQHADLVGWLVSKGAFVDARDGDGYTPMHTAASLGLRKVVAVLLDLGANPLLQSTNGENSLHMAANTGCNTLIARFIDLGIDVNARTNDGTTALHRVSRRGHASGVRMLLDEGADINESTDNGWTPLRFASAHKNAKVLECLLDFGKGDLRQTLAGVGNLLHTAAYHGSTAVMQLLVKRGLDVASTIVSNGETVMHHAAMNGRGWSVKWLLDNGASLDVQDHHGRKPQTSAVVLGTKDLSARSALEAIADSEDGLNRVSVMWNGLSLLHLAAAKGFDHCVRYLVSKGAEVNSKTADGDEQMAMHCAVTNNRTNTVRVLADSGACVDARDSSGTTPLHLAVAGDGHLDIATTLLELEASCNIADSGGRTPLWTAAKNGNLACCSLLVARGADLALRDNQGKNALGACLNGSHGTTANREEVMTLLIDLACPVGEAEVDAASRGGLADSFAKAVTARMSAGSSARELVKATSPADGWAATKDVGGVMPDAEPAVSMMTVRVSSEPPPTFSSRGRRASSASGVVLSSKVYHVDSLRLWRAVSHLEGPDEVGKCLLLKLLLPPPAGWAPLYRGRSSGGSSSSSTGSTDGQVERPGYTPSDAVLPFSSRPSVSLVSEVEMSCNGDDFDETGFEAVLEYLSTGQVVGATCGSIHGDFSATTHKVGAQAVAVHRAAAFFGLPRLQSMIRAWLKANGAEMEDDGTGVLLDPAEGSVTKKRKFTG